MQAPRAIGLLLCGGQSRRMGTDKALVDLEGHRLIEYPLAVLRAVCADVVLACGPTRRYQELGHQLALDPIDDGGPLAGLVAGLEAARAAGAEWVAVLACDMPRADARVLGALLERARRRELDACLLGVEAGVEPAYAVYRVRCAPAARRALLDGRRRLVSFRDESVDGRPLSIEVLPESALEAGAAAASALNLNTREDLERERRARAARGAGVAP